MAAHDLLLLHGTIYGELVPMLPWVDCQPKSANLDRWGSTTPWITTVPAQPILDALLVGTMTNNSPIDMINWTVTGSLPPTSGLEWWQDCLKLLVHL